MANARQRTNRKNGQTPNPKQEQLDKHRVRDDGRHLTTDQGIGVTHTDDSLKAGDRGPTLLEDFHFREKITHFDHERIPERVVHARGAGAYGFFQPYESMADVTQARFLADPAKQTPVFVRFSTVAGSRGSADTVRDVRGFATKFYTEDGNFDLVGNNMPIFFIQDAIKFPDLIHSVKPEPDHEMPQAASAHDTFYDFTSLVPESTHMLMWLLSDRALPRSFRMMQGFGIHTFRFVNAQGKATFVKFHWKPVLGTASMVWEECQEISGKDPDFLRRDLWEAIAGGDYPEWEFGVQLIPEEDEFKYDFDLLDPTKIVPEELVPVRYIGKMTLNRNPDNFFAETEQVAFHPANVVPGIDFSNDPLLQGRLFSYLDTQLIRLGGPNFAQIPINRPINEVHTNQRDGYMQSRVHTGKTSYFPNGLNGGCPFMASAGEGFVPYAGTVNGPRVRERNESFKDYFSQAHMFWDAQSDIEKEHLIAGAIFELSMCESMDVRERAVGRFNEVNHEFAVRVADGCGVARPAEDKTAAFSYHAPEVSVMRMAGDSIATRQIAAILDDGFDETQFNAMKRGLEGGGAKVKVIAKSMQPVRGSGGTQVTPDKTYATGASVMFDAVFVPGGSHVQSLQTAGPVLKFVAQAYKHGKALALLGESAGLMSAAGLPSDADGGKGVAIGTAANTATVSGFVDAIKAHRHWQARSRDLVAV